MSESRPSRPKIGLSLSARLLVLTVIFVMIAEVLIYAPSISRFRKAYLEDTVAKGHLAILALEATPDNMVSEELERDLLLHAAAHGIVLKKPDRRMLMLSSDMPPNVDATFDVRFGTFFGWIQDAFMALAEHENRVLRVIGGVPRAPDTLVEVIIDETPMREEMYAFSTRILTLSIFISLITAGLVYFSLQWMMVRPIRQITETMMHFRENPEDESGAAQPSDRSDEIGIAQRELAVMQSDLRTALHQKTRLATLGAAVAKINHDLRNTLATAMLASDGLADIDNPDVKRLTPRLYTAIDRAVDLCSQTLNYVRDAKPKMNPSTFPLNDLFADVETAVAEAEATNGAHLDLTDSGGDIEIDGDREQLFRALANLAVNAAQAGATAVRIDARREKGSTVVDVADDGPGLAPRARERLFQPFVGSTRKDGTGLGLVIARDIVAAHGGDLSLVDTDDAGTTFRIRLPARGA